MTKMTLILAIVLLPAISLAETLMVSHKGIWSNHILPANTEASLEKALENGFRGLEFDLLQAKSGEFILSHDNKIKRISNCHGKISELN